MSEDKNSYKQVLKATSIFGGVQFFGLIISVLKSKFIAILLGAEGMGIISLLNYTIELISELVKFGMDTSAVKNIGAAKMNKKAISNLIGVLKKLLLMSGFLGVMVSICLSSLLSELVFGNNEYVYAFICISIALLFKQIAIGQLSILQGLRKMNYLAKATLLSNFIGLIVAIPFYYYYGIKGIVPVIIINALVVFIVSGYFFKKARIISIKKTYSEAFSEGKPILKFGFFIGLKGAISLFSLYVFQLYIGHFGSVKELGLYSAGFIIINSYVGLIFNAMQVDYFPRLSEVINYRDKFRKVVQEQALIAVLIVTPVIILFLILSPYVIRTLYSKEFLEILGLVSWGILGVLFKTVSWSIGYVLIAKGDSKVFMRTSVFFSVLLLAMSVLGYHTNGLTGVGVSFFIYYIFHFFILKIITFKIYSFYFDKAIYRIFGITLLLVGGTFLSSHISSDIIKYICMICLFVLSLLYSFYYLNKNAGVMEDVKKLLNKRNNE